MRVVQKEEFFNLPENEEDILSLVDRLKKCLRE
jgi:hypothetical protein